MGTLVIENGTILTQNPSRDVIERGTVVVDDGTITRVEADPSADLDRRVDRRVDAENHVVIPGLIDTHVHVSDVLLRGAGNEGRGLYDWLFNVKQPGMAKMSPSDHELAAELYCVEALSAGITTIVENDAEIPIEDVESIERKLDVYEELGIRNAYARGIRDLPADEEFRSLIEKFTAKEPDVDHPPQERYIAATDEWMEHVESLHDTHHGRGNRQEIWIAPVIVEGMTTEGLRAAVEFAERHDVMTTTHVSEAPEQEAGALSSVEYLNNIGYLGEHTLLGHCVQVSNTDVRLLAETNTAVAHNIPSNMKLASGFAPVPSMRRAGVTIGLGTDNSVLSDSVNLLADMRLIALAHKGHSLDPGVLSAQSVLDMATIEGASAMGRSAELGSIEAGKRADLVCIDMDAPQLTPASDVVSAVVYQTLGSEVDLVVCEGEVVYEDGSVSGVRTDPRDLYEQVRTAATALRHRAGLPTRTDASRL